MCVKPTSRTFLFVSPKDIFLGGEGQKNNKRLHFNTTSSLHHFVVILFMTNLLRRKKPLSEQLQHQYLFSFKGKYIVRQSAGEQLHQRKKQNALRVQRVIHNRSYNPQIRGLHNLLIWSEGEAHLLPLRAVHARDSSRVSLTVCSKHLQVRGVHICILDGGLQLSLPGIKGEEKKKKKWFILFLCPKKIDQECVCTASESILVLVWPSHTDARWVRLFVGQTRSFYEKSKPIDVFAAVAVDRETISETCLLRHFEQNPITGWYLWHFAVPAVLCSFFGWTDMDFPSALLAVSRLSERSGVEASSGKMLNPRWLLMGWHWFMSLWTSEHRYMLGGFFRVGTDSDY